MTATLTPPTPARGLTFADELRRAADLLRGPDYANFPDRVLLVCLATILDREAVSCQWQGGIPAVDVLDAARAVNVATARARMTAPTPREGQ